MFDVPKNKNDWWELVDVHWEELRHNIDDLLELNTYQNFFNRKTRNSSQLNKLEVYKEERDPKIKYFFKHSEIEMTYRREVNSKEMVKLIEILNKYSHLV